VAATTGMHPYEPRARERPAAALRAQRLLGSPARVAGLWSAFAGVILTVVLKVVPGLDFAYQRPALRAGLETAEALVALFVAYLVIGRLRRNRRLDDFIAAIALGTLAGGSLIFGVIPTLATQGHADSVAGWAGIGARVVGAVLFAVAAFAPRRPLPSLLRASAAAAVITGSALLLVTFGAWALSHNIPAPAPPAGGAVEVGHSGLLSHGGDLAFQLMAMLAYTAAAVGFARSSERRPEDDLLRWFGAAAVFGTYASLSSSLSPALFYTDWVYPADVLLLLFYLMLLVGAVREINGYWRRSALAAVLEERRRLARDLHDGLAQELAYITRASKQLARTAPDSPLPARLEAAADRAMKESRLVIAALGTPADGPLEAVLERVAHDAAARFGVAVDLEIGSGARLDPARQEALIRITGEAVTNAARHSGTSSVRVVLQWPAGRPRLQVIDRGSGFVPGTATGDLGGFGITSMRERAAAVGANFSVRTAPGDGTLVEVVF
jgi:signal transduction histidine kinase